MKYPKLVRDEKYPEMYRILWRKDTLSDMVNKTRAKEYIRCYELTEANKQRKIAI